MLRSIEIDLPKPIGSVRMQLYFLWMAAVRQTASGAESKDPSGLTVITVRARNGC